MTKSKQVAVSKSFKAAAKTASKPTRRTAAIKPVKVDPPVAAVTSPPTSKRLLIENMIQRAEGATIAELITATGWQAHSIRAVLSGLRKDGSTIARNKSSDGISCYRIEKSA